MTNNNFTRDMVIGAISGYDWDKIKYWCNSLDRSGFDGHKVLIVYNGSLDLIKKLEEKKYTVVFFEKDEDRNIVHFPIQGPEIVVHRFIHESLFLEQILSKNDIRYVIATDVKDLVFQSNPSEWLTRNMGESRLLAGSEGVFYEEEAWGHQNMRDAYGPFFQTRMNPKMIWNAGTLAGDAVTFKDFCMNVFLACYGNSIHNPDQAAVNILLTLEPYKSITKFADHADGWACQCGTVFDPTKKDLWELTNHDRPSINVDGYVTPKLFAPPFVLVHQYDRNVELKEIIQKKYED